MGFSLSSGMDTLVFWTRFFKKLGEQPLPQTVCTRFFTACRVSSSASLKVCWKDHKPRSSLSPSPRGARLSGMTLPEQDGYRVMPELYSREGLSLCFSCE